MCCSCGCGEPGNGHGDDRNVTCADLQAAADAAGVPLEQAIQNIQACAPQKSRGGTVIRKSFPAVVTKTDAKTGTVEAFVNCTGITDLQGDVMEPGCWGDVIKAAKAGETDWPSLCWGHDWSLTTGKVLDAEEVAPGDPRLPERIAKSGAGALRIVGQYNLDTQRGREAFSDVDFGAVKQWSVGFMPDQAQVRWEKGNRHLGRVAEWPETSNVLVGASPGTVTALTKGVGPVPSADDRRQHTAARLERARRLAKWYRAWARMIGKSKLDTEEQREGAKYKLRDSEGKVKFPINDCADVDDAWGLRGSSSIPQDKVERHIRHAASELGCDGPWNAGDGGKAADDDMYGLPALSEDEAQHTGPLTQALDGIKALIAQECAEPGYAEFGDIIALACVGQDLIRWAQGEASEYGAMDFPIWALFDAGRKALARQAEAESLRLSDDALAALAHLYPKPTETPDQPLHPNAPDDDGSDGLTHFARRMARPRMSELVSSKP